MMLVLTIFVVFGLLMISEFWWRKQRAHNEFSRKFVHITVGSFVAFWPFFLTWNQIRAMSLAFLIVVAISKYLHIFRAIHSAQRPTMGELFFALSVGAVTIITQDKWIYMVALLQMSLADGLAAIIGIRYGQRHRYTVFGHTKSLLGTFTFFIVSLTLLIAGFSYASGSEVPIPFAISLAVVMSLIENIGIQGIDNLLIPILVASVLRLVA